MRFATHIRPLVRIMDRESMKFAVDLWAYEDVAIYASAILVRLQQGTMPCDRAWKKEKVNVFSRWIEAGTPE